MVTRNGMLCLMCSRTWVQSLVGSNHRAFKIVIEQRLVGCESGQRIRVDQHVFLWTVVTKTPTEHVDPMHSDIIFLSLKKSNLILP